MRAGLDMSSPLHALIRLGRAWSMKYRMIVSVVLALLVGSVTVVATTGIAGSSAEKPGGCTRFDWQGTSTSRSVNSSSYIEDGVVTRGVKNATYHLVAQGTFTAELEPGWFFDGDLTLDAGNGDTLLLANLDAVIPGTGTQSFGGVAYVLNGFGKFFESSGQLTVSGTFNFDASQPVTRTYVGQLCLP
jgi:hypothetical protein